MRWYCRRRDQMERGGLVNRLLRDYRSKGGFFRKPWLFARSAAAALD